MKYKYIDLAKTLTMFMVIFAHCVLPVASCPFWAESAEKSHPFHIYCFNFVDVSTVPIFVFTAGFLFASHCKGKSLIS